jgi:hypothetical protein
MKLMLITCTGGCRPGLEALLERHGVAGYTEIPNVLGRGATGKHFGTRAHPGTASVFFTALPDEKAADVSQALKAAAGACAVGEGMHVYTLTIQEVVE